MKTYYFDHAATSCPKAPGVAEKMNEYVTCCGANVNRGTYSSATEAENTVLDTRIKLSAQFGFSQKPNQVIFTPGATWGLNTLLLGYLRPGDHVIVSSMEHNAVMRPLSALAQNGVEVSRIPADVRGAADPGGIRPLIKKNTRLMLVCHASNVCGTLFPIEEASRICRQEGIPLAVDAAQTAGHMKIDFDALGLSALCVPGHKGLRGPQGIGALLLDKEFSRELSPLISGGTGSSSQSEIQPDFLPDKFESGTLNLPGIYGLNAALTYLEQQNMDAVREREKTNTSRFIDGLRGARAITHGTRDASLCVGVVSVGFDNMDNAAAAYALEREYGILTRCGLHCAPNAHKTLKTFPEGTVRFSFGHDTISEDIDYAAEAVCALAARA